MDNTKTINISLLALKTGIHYTKLRNAIYYGNLGSLSTNEKALIKPIIEEMKVSANEKFEDILWKLNQ